MTTFDDERPRLLGIAYRLLGSFADAEDVVQETWIAWNEVDAASVDNPAAYLAKAVTHRALNRIRTLARRREDYIGDWLPEPVSSARLPDEAAEIADSVSFAMLVMLERLSPLERAAFILRDVFDVSTADVADTLERSPEAVRKLVSRARSRLKDDPPDDADTASHTRTSLAFADAVQRGDADALVGYRDRAPQAARAHPTEEHYLPLLVALGAIDAADPRVRIDGGMTYGVLSMDSFAFGLPEVANAALDRVAQGEVA